jgi:hypothetical protein
MSDIIELLVIVLVGLYGTDALFYKRLRTRHANNYHIARFARNSYLWDLIIINISIIIVIILEVVKHL